MSTHICEVVPVVLKKHDNADSLSIATVKGWQCVVKTADFDGVDKGIYIPIDMVVPDTEEWKWLENRRVKTHKFRGAISQGLLVPAKKGMKLGQDVTEETGCIRYVPKIPGFKNQVRGGYQIAPPPGMVKYTDIENYKNYTDVFNPSDIVVVTEKIHGANARFALLSGKFYIGSHNTVRMPIPPEPTSWFGKFWINLMRKMEIKPLQRKPDEWQRVADNYDIENKMRSRYGNFVDVILFGEIYGPRVQKLHYGVPEGETHIRFFDIMINGDYLDCNHMKFDIATMQLDTVPEIKTCSFSEAMKLVDGQAFSGNHVREGIVIKPWVGEETHPHIGRKIIKLISDKYLLKDIDELPENE